MITVSMSVSVDASRGRVWNALISPDAVAAWSPERSMAVSVPADYPKPGSPARWRFRLHGVAMPMTELPVEVVPAERLRTELRLSLVNFDQTWTLASEDGSDRTRLSLKLTSPNSIAMVGEVLDRFAVRELVQEIVDENLRAARAWCERE